MSSYAIAHVDEIDEIDDGRCPMRPVRHHFGIRAFGVNAWTGSKAGDRIINEHDESEPDSDEELYLVLSGRAAFELDGERRDAPAGTFVFVPPGVKRTAFAEVPGTTIVSVGGAPGKAYEIRGWELWGTIRPLYDAGRYAEAAERGRELLAADPENPSLAYNVACCESLAGSTAEALVHLRRAIELSDAVRSYAKDDPDLEAVRADPAFAEVVGD